MSLDPLTLPSAFGEAPVERWYAWPDDCAVYSAPCDGYIWEPSPEDPRIYIPVAYAPTIQKRKYRPEEPPVRTAVYRAYDASDHLLYVGISGTPEKRWVHHSDHKPWWPEVARVSLDWRDSRAEALRIEAEAICQERPVHNVQHNGKGRGKPQ